MENENIHAPTVPSGPTSSGATNGNSTHLSFAELQRKKDEVETELKALGSALDSVNDEVLTPKYCFQTDQLRSITSIWKRHYSQETGFLVQI